MGEIVSEQAEPKGKSFSNLNVANVLTIVRLILVPVFLVLMLVQDSLAARAWATVVFCVAAATDHLDGMLARRLQIVTNFGKIADPIADKALVIGAFIMLSVVGQLPVKYYWWFLAMIIGRELAVTLLRMQALKKGVVIPANRWGKAKTVTQLLLIFLMLIHVFFEGGAFTAMSYVIQVLLVATFVITGLSGFIYFLDARSSVKADVQADPRNSSNNS